MLLIDDLRYFDASRRGYVLAEFTLGAATGSYRFVDTLASTAYTVTEQHNTTVSV